MSVFRPAYQILGAVLLTIGFWHSASAEPLMRSPLADRASYIEGGIGSDDKANMEAKKSSYNLHITNSNGSGEFTFSDSLLISDAEGKVVISTGRVDPLFWASLPPGKYTITAVHGDQNETRKVSISADKATNLAMVW